MLRNSVTIAILAGLFSAARAELPPSFYEKVRAECGEAVIIRVESVSTKAMKGKEDGTREVTVTAVVVAVQRSKSGLKKGEKLVIRYENLDEVKDPPLGSGSVPVIREGEFYPAFLDREKGKQEFEPAARWMSFML